MSRGSNHLLALEGHHRFQNIMRSSGQGEIWDENE
jgi:hypothetical protein